MIFNTENLSYCTTLSLCSMDNPSHHIHQLWLQFILSLCFVCILHLSNTGDVILCHGVRLPLARPQYPTASQLSPCEWERMCGDKETHSDAVSLFCNLPSMLTVYCSLCAFLVSVFFLWCPTWLLTTEWQNFSKQFSPIFFYLVDNKHTQNNISVLQWCMHCACWNTCMTF